MTKIYKTSLVRCFRLLSHTYAELTDFCRRNAIEPPSLHNWDREWWRCRHAADVLRSRGTRVRALAAASDKDRLLTGDRAESVLSAARCLAFGEPACEQDDVAKWAGKVKQWKMIKSDSSSASHPLRN